MQVEIVVKYSNDSIEDFEVKVNKRINELNKHYHVCFVKIQNYKDTLIASLIYKPLI
jgi:hypothetical protein